MGFLLFSVSGIDKVCRAVIDRPTLQYYCLAKVLEQFFQVPDFCHMLLTEVFSIGAAGIEGFFHDDTGFCLVRPQCVQTGHKQTADINHNPVLRNVPHGILRPTENHP